MVAFLTVLTVICALVAIIYAPIWWPHLVMLLRFRRTHGKGKRKLPLFVPFPLPFFGHSMQLYPHELQQEFVTRNHEKYGPAFGFYLQDLVFFCLDIDRYGKEVNASPCVKRADLPVCIAPLKGVAERGIFAPFVRGLYTKHLRRRLPFMQKQLEDFLRAEFPENKAYVREMHVFLQRLVACYTLATWCGLDFGQMIEDDLINKLCNFFNTETQLKTVTLAFPRLAILARFMLNKHRRGVESFLIPMVNGCSHDSSVHHDDDDGENSPKDEARPLVHTMAERHDIKADQMVDYFVKFMPLAMSIGATAENLYPRVMANAEVLARVEAEQVEVVRTHGDVLDESALNQMNFLDDALKETLRLEFTLASFRAIAEDLVLHDDIVLPAGSHIILTGSAVNYDEQMFPNSQHWDPLRWEKFRDEEKDSGNKTDAFIWGRGKIICPGRTHAMLGMKLIIAVLLRNHHCRYTEDGYFTFQPKHVDSKA